MSNLKFNKEQLLLIGNIDNFYITNTIKIQEGDSLNESLYGFKIELRYKSLLPSAKLLSNFDNSWFKPNNATLKDIVITFETLLELLEYLNPNEGIKIELLSIQSDRTFFHLLLSLSEKNPFKVAFNSLCIKYKNVIYIIHDTNEENTCFRHLIADDLRHIFNYKSNINSKLAFHLTKAIESIYKDPSLVILDNGKIVYKGIEYADHEKIIYSPEFIKDYFLKINWS